MGHLTATERLATICVDRTTGRVFVQQDWQYHWELDLGVTHPWTLAEKRRFYHAADNCRSVDQVLVRRVGLCDGRSSSRRYDRPPWRRGAMVDGRSAGVAVAGERRRGADRAVSRGQSARPGGCADDAMFVFAATARSFAGLTLGDLIAAPPHLPTTVSHRVWATAFGIDSRGDYVIETVEGRRFRFALPDARSMAPGRGR